NAIKKYDGCFGSARGVAQRCTQSCQQFARAEGFGDVVVRAQFEQKHFVGDITGGAEHNDRKRGRLGLNFFAQVSSRELGQAQIENNGRRRRSLKAFQRRLSVGAHFHREAFGFEQTFQRFLNRGIVLNNENAAGWTYWIGRVERLRRARGRSKV